MSALKHNTGVIEMISYQISFTMWFSLLKLESVFVALKDGTGGRSLPIWGAILAAFEDDTPSWKWDC